MADSRQQKSRRTVKKSPTLFNFSTLRCNNNSRGRNCYQKPSRLTVTENPSIWRGNVENYLDWAGVQQATERDSKTIRAWMAQGRFPRPTHRSGRRVYWLRSEVELALARMSLPVPIHQADMAASG
jgi:predicted DNA-binding transcriptional regulator AlpA